TTPLSHRHSAAARQAAAADERHARLHCLGSEEAMVPIGRISEINRYPVKSMAGVSADAAVLGWHGLAGDRRFALRRTGDYGSFPWLTASSLPELLRYRPIGL